MSSGEQAVTAALKSAVSAGHEALASAVGGLNSAPRHALKRSSRILKRRVFVSTGAAAPTMHAPFLEPNGWFIVSEVLFVGK